MVANATTRKPERSDGGFTLIELLIVMTIIALLASIAIPSYIKSVQKAEEAVLREDLHTLRTAIDSYTVDKEKAPQSLEDLVQAGYLKSIPDGPHHAPQGHLDYQPVRYAERHQPDAGRH